MEKEDFLLELQFLHKNLLHYLEYWPEGKNDWQPTENSFSLLKLASHLYNLPGDYALILGGELEKYKEIIKSDWTEKDVNDLKESLDRGVKLLQETIQSFSNAEMTEKLYPWPFGEPLTAKKHLFTLITHMYHHRGQLHLYLKQLGQPVNTETLFHA